MAFIDEIERLNTLNQEVNDLKKQVREVAEQQGIVVEEDVDTMETLLNKMANSGGGSSSELQGQIDALKSLVDPSYKTGFNNDISKSNVVKLKSYSLSDYRYYKLCEFLPQTDQNNYSSISIEGRLGGWVSTDMAQWEILFSNRNSYNSVASVLSLSSKDGLTICDLVVYEQEDKSCIMYLKCFQYYTTNFEISTVNCNNVYDGTFTTEEPSGTLKWSLSTSDYIKLNSLGGGSSGESTDLTPIYEQLRSKVEKMEVLQPNTTLLYSATSDGDGSTLVMELPVGGAVPIRTQDGTLRANDPLNDADLTTKRYVDNALAGAGSGGGGAGHKYFHKVNIKSDSIDCEFCYTSNNLVGLASNVSTSAICADILATYTGNSYSPPSFVASGFGIADGKKGLVTYAYVDGESLIRLNIVKGLDGETIGGSTGIGYSASCRMDTWEISY